MCELLDRTKEEKLFLFFYCTRRDQRYFTLHRLQADVAMCDIIIIAFVFPLIVDCQISISDLCATQEA